MNYIVMLVNNTTFLDFFCKTKAQMKNVTYIFVNDTRRKDLTAEITDVLNENAVLNAYVIDSKEILEAFVRETKIDNEFLRNYVLTIKMLLPWYFFQSSDVIKVAYPEKFVFLDDDLIVLRDIAALFDYKFACGAERFINVHEGEEWERLKLIFDTNMTLEQYNRRRLNSGVMVLSEGYDYGTMLKRIFMDDYFNKVYHEVKNFKTLRDGLYKIFFLDGKFYNMVMKCNDYSRITNINIKILQDRFESKRDAVFLRRLKDWHIIHYCGGRDKKIDYVKWLAELYGLNSKQF